MRKIIKGSFFILDRRLTPVLARFFDAAGLPEKGLKKSLLTLTEDAQPGRLDKKSWGRWNARGLVLSFWFNEIFALAVAGRVGWMAAGCFFGNI